MVDNFNSKRQTLVLILEDLYNLDANILRVCIQVVLTSFWDGTEPSERVMGIGTCDQSRLRQCPREIRSSP